MQYILNEEEYKQYMDIIYEVGKLKTDNKKLVKENQELDSLKAELRTIKDDLNKCIRIELGSTDTYAKFPNKITKSKIRKHFVANLILKHSDVGELYNIEQIVDTIQYE